MEMREKESDSGVKKAKPRLERVWIRWRVFLNERDSEVCGRENVYINDCAHL